MQSILRGSYSQGSALMGIRPYKQCVVRSYFHLHHLRIIADLLPPIFVLEEP